MNKDLRIAILQANFDSQHDFADAVNMHPPIVSNVIHNRKRLTKAEAKIWQKVLKCKRSILNRITE